MHKSQLRLSILIATTLASRGFPSANAATQEACCPTPMAEKAGASTPASSYPLTTCVVSGEALEGGDMGGPVDYIYKEAGKPDRLVRFCCSGCIKKFKKDPSKYLAKLDTAAGTAGKHDQTPCAKPSDAHAAHAH